MPKSNRDKLRAAELFTVEPTGDDADVIDGLNRQDVDALVRVQEDLRDAATAAGKEPDHYFTFVRF